MRRTVGVAALLAALSLPGSALAWPGAYEGQPGALRPGVEGGAYLWRDGEGFHHLVGVGHSFDPWTLDVKVTTDGVIHDVDAAALEANDTVDREGEGSLKAIFVLSTRADHLRFRVRDAGWLEYELWVNGSPMGTDSIHVGADGRHPLDSRFRLYN